ncbi:phosphoglycerate mutase-like protein 4 [Impatiens glandulifera]|uniref:phosphoglycerate mutase-like protein 4 n=1 Tax=Impatiens glandulifera TaxID=253017 RepID=UPI001FB07D59|nr:phosphoglycerate mutase-like protein 4 [Impatiens glandulifera]
MANSDSRDLTQLNGCGKKSEVDELAYAEIVVIRHGETEWNACGKIQGHLDVELNDVGKEQAEAVANRLSKESKLSAVYSSDLKRALVTAERIASICGVGEVIKDKNLRERHLGDLQGTVYAAAPEVCPAAYKAFSSPRDQEIPGGGESLQQLYDRGTSILQKIADKHIGERVAVVSHGGLIRALYRRSVSTVKCGKVLNTSVNVFHITKGGSWTIKNWCDVTHLKQTEFLEAGFGGDKNSG